MERGNGIRTRDIQLGKLTLYQLSYSRETVNLEDIFRCVNAPRNTL